MPIIGDVEVIHPRRALLQIAWCRKKARDIFGFSLLLVLCYSSIYAGFIWLSTPDPSARHELLVVLAVCAAIGVLILLPSLVRCVRIAIWGQVLTFSRETGTIERNGKLLARFDEVSCVEISRRINIWRGDDPGSPVEFWRLSIILKPHERVRICEVSEAERAAQVELAKELGHMLGVGVTIPQ